MALIGEIRKRSWILIVLIGLGMGGFLLMDMLGNLGVSGLTTPTDVGSINGKKISAQEFFAKEQEIFGSSAQGDPLQRKDQIWDYFIQETILDEKADKLGLMVSDEEMEELFTVGPNISPVVINYFGGYQNFNVEQFNQYKTQIETITDDTDQVRQAKSEWASLKSRVKLDRQLTKLNALVTQSVYTPTWMAEMDNAEKTEKMNFQFVGIPFASIPDSEVKVTNSDIKSYISKNAYKYQRKEETRKAAYVSFDVIPTLDDSTEIKTKVADQLEDFRASDDDSLFISGTNGSFQADYQKKSALSPLVADSLFKLPIGSVVGPYLEGRQYKAVKLVDRKVLRDSVKVRHILRTVEQPEFNIPGMDAARELIDSLKGVLQSGANNFDSLAVKFSQDESNKAKGGDLGWNTPGTFVPEFNNLVFYDAKVNGLYIVETQFGVHLVQVLNSKSSGVVGARVAYLTEDIIPSSKTVKDVRNKAFEFVGKYRSLKALTKVADEDKSVSLVSTPEMKKSDHNIIGLGGGSPSRSLVKWLFKAKTGEVAKDLYTYQDNQLYYDSKFVVVALESKQGKGTPSVKDVKSQVETLVKNQLKAEKIIAKIKAGDNLDAIAGQFQSSVQEGVGASFAESFVQGMGNEPTVLGKIFGLELNKVSTPLVGNNAVFVVVPNFKGAATPITDFANAKKGLSNTTKTGLQNSLFQSLKKNAKIKDNRTTFY